MLTNHLIKNTLTVNTLMDINTVPVEVVKRSVLNIIPLLFPWFLSQSI